MGLIAIGDIHGCVHTLGALLERLDPTPDDHLVFLGDYVDRGPDPKGVIDYLLDVATSIPCSFLRGNHESLMLDYLDRAEYELWSVNGAASTLRSYVSSGFSIEIPGEHEVFIRNTLLYLDTPDFFFVHAGIVPHLTIQENLRRGSDRIYLWERSHLDAVDLAWEKPVVCAHTPRPEPINRERLISIDTGCVYFSHPGLGHLTAVRLPEREFVRVKYVG
jgi:serine/threonine protein phosphatase 1